MSDHCDEPYVDPRLREPLGDCDSYDGEPTTTLSYNQMRLLRFAQQYANGSWSPLGEDAKEDVEYLEELGLVEICADSSRFRLAEQS